MWRFILMIVLVLALGLGATVSYFNAQAVQFNYLFGEWQVPLIALLIVDLVLGVLIGMLAMAGRVVRLRFESRRLRTRIRGCEAELRSLRNLPVERQTQPDKVGSTGA